MFQGADTLSLDAKGRLAVPARHQPELALNSAGRLVVNYHPHGCLKVYPESVWQPIADKLSKIATMNPATAAVRRVILGTASVQEADSTGRLLLPPALRSLAKLDKQVMLVGMGDHFEIWSEDSWVKQNELALAALQDPEALASFEGIVL